MSTEKIIQCLANWGVTATDLPLLTQAITHPSATKKPHYQRLEFLGDRVLALVIAQWLQDIYPKANEGKLAQRLAFLVCRDTLARLARRMNLDEAIILAPSEEKSGGRENPAILADVLEAVIAALYLSQSLEIADHFIRRLWDEVVKEDPADSKSTLQMAVQVNGRPPPTYEVIDQSGPAHKPRFTVQVKANGETATGAGRSLRQAEQKAAKELLDHLLAKEPVHE
ncbi:MAG: ribonuclease III [Pseudomonadota bacterium]